MCSMWSLPIARRTDDGPIAVRALVAAAISSSMVRPFSV